MSGCGVVLFKVATCVTGRSVVLFGVVARMAGRLVMFMVILGNGASVVLFVDFAVQFAALVTEVLGLSVLVFIVASPLIDPVTWTVGPAVLLLVVVIWVLGSLVELCTVATCFTGRAVVVVRTDVLLVVYSVVFSTTGRAATFFVVASAPPAALVTGSLGLLVVLSMVVAGLVVGVISSLIVLVVVFLLTVTAVVSACNAGYTIEAALVVSTWIRIRIHASRCRSGSLCRMGRAPAVIACRRWSEVSGGERPP